MSGPRMRRVIRKDQHRCGVHAGGCGQIVDKIDRSLDHIIPQSFFRSRGNNISSTDFDDDWNRQIMHRTCDNWSGGHLHGLPPFWCHCHYLRVLEKDLYVFVRDAATGEENENHLLLRDFVRSSGNPRGLSVFTAPVSNNPKSWDKSRTLRLDDQNTNVHYLLCITPNMVDSFNQSQINRANRVLDAYKGIVPDFSQKYLGPIYGRDLQSSLRYLAPLME